MNFRSEIRTFLEKRMPDGKKFDDQESLLANGVIDSLKMLDLLSFIEEKFGVTVDDDEMMPDNFDSIDAIVAFLVAKERGVDA